MLLHHNPNTRTRHRVISRFAVSDKTHPISIYPHGIFSPSQSKMIISYVDGEVINAESQHLFWLCKFIELHHHYAILLVSLNLCTPLLIYTRTWMMCLGKYEINKWFFSTLFKWNWSNFQYFHNVRIMYHPFGQHNSAHIRSFRF